MVADRLCEGGAELEIIESFLDDDEGLEAVARFLGGELGPERRVAPLKVQDPDGLGVAEDGRADLCVCICEKVKKGVCVGIDLTCFCWEVFWGWTFFWELSSFGNFLSLSFFFVCLTTVDDGK